MVVDIGKKEYNYYKHMFGICSALFDVINVIIGGVYVERDVDIEDVGKQEIKNNVKVLEDALKVNADPRNAEFINNIKDEEIDIDSLSADEIKILFERLLFNLELN